MWGILLIIVLWSIFFIEGVILAERGNKKGFYCCFGGCILLIVILFVISLWMMY